MLTAFEKFEVGKTDSIDWCFENTHFQKRLQDNGISREFIVNTVMYDEPLRYEKSGSNEYSVYFEAPPTKKYNEIKVVFACEGNRIDLVTIMPEGTTERQKNTFKSKEYKDAEKKRKQAMSKVKHLY